MDRGAWQATVHRVTKSQTQLKQLSTHTSEHISWGWFWFCHGSAQTKVLVRLPNFNKKIIILPWALLIAKAFGSGFN